MVNIVVIGGTGYAGSHILKEAAARGHDLVSLSRSAPADPVQGVRYEHGSAADADVLSGVIAGADVVVGSLSPFGDLAEAYVETYRRALPAIAANGARLVVIGGFSALRPAEGAPRIIDGGNVPAEYYEGARKVADLLELLIAEAPETLDWLFVSPAAQFGAFAPGERTGRYRTGGEVALFEGEGGSHSAIGGADFALAVVDEIEKPTVRRGQIGFAY